MGFGYDIHRLEPGRPLFLGGISIPFSRGLIGHSDGDCLLHAIIDALLGALGDRDIGQVFPDSDPQYLNIRSTRLLEEIVIVLQKKNAKIVNIDTVIVAEQPKLAPFLPHMKSTLSRILSLDSCSIGIKAKTHEGMEAAGLGDALSAYATVLHEMDG